MIRWSFFVWLCFGIGVTSLAQNSDTKTLTEAEYLYLVGRFHPVAQRADLQLERGTLTVQRARGGFDPYLSGSYDRKRYDDKTYFDLVEGGFVQPGWFGTEIKAGYEYSNGQFVNPENNLPDQGLMALGVKVPLGQGLFMNERMGALQQAKIFAQAQEVEQRRMINDLFFDALTAYWKWSEAEATLDLYNQVLQLAEERFRATKTSFQQGDKPAIDTTEALLQVQQFGLQQQAALLNAAKMRLLVSNYLWTPQQEPLLLSDNVYPQSLNDPIPQPVQSDTLNALLNGLDEQHPELLTIDYALQELEVERRLKIEKIKPKLNVETGVLVAPGDGFEGVNNYKVGLGLDMPLTARTARADLALQRLKIQETEWKQREKTLQIENKLRAMFIEIQNTNTQINQMRSMITNYNRMAQAERIRFSIGESSLFLVNSREIKYLEAMLKNYALRSKYQRANAGFRWAAGVLGNE